MPFVKLQGFELHYILEGDPDAPVVLLSNSLGSDLSMWDAQVPALLPFARVLRYDTRGHGRSGMPPPPTTLAGLGHDVTGLLDALGIARAHIIGVSLGGIAAMWLGLNAPTYVQSLVLSNTAAMIGNNETWSARIEAVRRGGLAAIADAVPARWFTPDVQAGSCLRSRARSMLLHCSADGYMAASAALRDTDLSQQIHNIAARTLVISGAQDAVTPPDRGRALQSAIPGAIFQEVPGAHLPNIEFPDAYNRAMLDFLQPQLQQGAPA